MDDQQVIPSLTDQESDLLHAATVAVVRDGPDGIETLMLRKNASISFGGMWVFPGGRVDDEDHAAPLGDDELGAHRAAAVREAAEEADVVLPRDPSAIVAMSFWVPPMIEQKRYATWFFVARWPLGDAGLVTIDQGEILDEQWARPRDLLARRDAGEVALVPPTWVTLDTIARFDTVDDLLAHLRVTPPAMFHTRAARTHDGMVTMWEGDAGWETTDVQAPGARHRLLMSDAPWQYDHTDR